MITALVIVLYWFTLDATIVIALWARGHRRDRMAEPIPYRPVTVEEHADQIVGILNDELHERRAAR